MYSPKLVNYAVSPVEDNTKNKNRAPDQNNKTSIQRKYCFFEIRHWFEWDTTPPKGKPCHNTACLAFLSIPGPRADTRGIQTGSLEPLSWIQQKLIEPNMFTNKNSLE